MTTPDPQAGRRPARTPGVPRTPNAPATLLVAVALALTVAVPALPSAPAQAPVACDLEQDDAGSGGDANRADPVAVDAGAFAGCVDRVDRRDVYLVNGTAGLGLSVSVEPSGCPEAGAGLSLLVFDEEGSLAGSGSADGCDEAASALWLAGNNETFTLQVSPTRGLRVDYDLAVDPAVPTPCKPADDAGMGRDATPSDPVALTDGAWTGCVSIFDPADAYELSPTDGDRIDLELVPPADADGGCADVDLALLDRWGRELAASRTEGCASETVTWTAAYGGPHVAVVERVDGGGDYTLDVNVTFQESDGVHEPGWPDLAQARIRPGATQDGRCTANFVFSNADNSTLYIGTASHCVGGHWLGDPVRLGGIADAGVLAYCSWAVILETGEYCPDNGGATGLVNVNDFALIRIRDEHRHLVHPALLHYGGPTGIGEEMPTGTHVLTYGNSALWVGDVTNAREGVVLDQNPWTTQVYMAPPSVPGDSGSAFITADGRTVGVLSTLILFPTTGANSVVRLDKALAFANEHTDLDVELKTFPLLAGSLVPEA